MTQSEMSLGAVRAINLPTRAPYRAPAILEESAQAELEMLDGQRRDRGITLRQLLVLDALLAVVLGALAFTEATDVLASGGDGVRPLGFVVAMVGTLLGLLLLTTAVFWLRWTSAGHREIAMLAGREVPWGHSIFLDFTIPLFFYVRPIWRQVESMNALEELGVSPPRGLAWAWWVSFLTLWFARTPPILGRLEAGYMGELYGLAFSSTVLVVSAYVARRFVGAHDRATNEAFALTER